MVKKGLYLTCGPRYRITSCSTSGSSLLQFCPTDIATACPATTDQTGDTAQCLTQHTLVQNLARESTCSCMSTTHHSVKKNKIKNKIEPLTSSQRFDIVCSFYKTYREVPKMFPAGRESEYFLIEIFWPSMCSTADMTSLLYMKKIVLWVV